MMFRLSPYPVQGQYNKNDMGYNTVRCNIMTIVEQCRQNLQETMQQLVPGTMAQGRKSGMMSLRIGVKHMMLDTLCQAHNA